MVWDNIPLNQWLENYSDAEYHANKDFLGSTSLKTIYTKSPKHFKYERENPIKPTPAMELGSIIHDAVLRPWTRDLIRVEPSVDKRTKAGKDQIEAFKNELPDGAVILTSDQADTVLGVCNAILENKTSRTMLSNGVPESPAFFEYQGVKFKIKPDFRRNDGYLIDLKTSRSCDPFKFGYDASDSGYLIQAALYSKGYEIVQGEKPKAFIFLVVEKEPPFDLAFYNLSDAAIDAGNAMLESAIEKYKQCVSKNEWPGIAPKIVDLWLPNRVWEIK